jgi:HPt (histidine-containing phosphotransfer) domain-containing protein
MSSQTPQIINQEAIDNLRSLGDAGDDTFLKEIITIYLEDIPQRIVALKTALNTGDRPLFTRSAHTIKGSSANIGAAEVQYLAAKLELKSKTEELSGLGAELVELEAASMRAQSALRSILGN